MGEISEAMLDGTLCEGCGMFMGDECGYPRRCSDCDDIGDIERPQPSPAKIPCPHCKKLVKQAGLHDHIRDVHKQVNR